MNTLNKVICLLSGHDDNIERVMLDERMFISLGLCKRCHRQWWMKGEMGAMRGVRIIVTSEEEL